MPASALHVVTYNLLATRYIRRHYYPNVADQHLEPSWRHPRLVDAAEALDADLLCLQEVEEALFEALERRLRERYAARLAMKAQGKPDGAALFARYDALELKSCDVLRYDDGDDATPSSGHVAQIARLRWGDATLGVANTHLRWDPRERPRDQKIGVRQARQLISSRERIAPGCDGWLVCGDLNAAPGSDVLQSFAAAGLRCLHAGSGSHTCNANGRLQLIDHLLVSSRIEATPLAPPPIAADTPLPNDEQPSDHLPLAATLRIS